MAKGNIAKEQIKSKLLETFPGSFVYDGGKEIRIPMTEDGSLVQIKITLTCAKVNVTPDGEEEGPAPSVEGQLNFGGAAQNLQPTAEEKETMAALLKSLGL